MTGVPYHTDTWQQLANVQTLLAKTPVPLAPGNGFDQYNIYWPGITLLGSALTLVVGPSVAKLMPVMAPLVSSSSALLFLVLLRRIGLDLKLATMASLLYAVSGAEAVISAGVTKEAFATPLLFVVLILLLEGLRGSNVSAGLSVLTFASLTVYHHLTAVVALSLSVFLVVAYAARPETRRRSLTVGVAVIAVNLGVAAVYLLWYAFTALKVSFGPSDAISVLAFEGIALAPLAYQLYVGIRATRMVAIWMGTVYAGVILILLLSLKYTVFILSPQLNPVVILLVAPYLLAGLLAVLAAARRDLLSSSGLVFGSIWVLGLMGLEGYAIFGTPGLLGVIFRLWNFVYPGVLILAGYVLARIYSSGNLSRVLGIILIIFAATGSAYLLPYTAFSAGQLGGSQRVYQPGDLATAGWVSQNIASNSSVLGDIRFSSLASYYSLPVQVNQGLLVAEGVAPLEKGCFLYDSLMAQVGFVFAPYGSTSAASAAQSLVSARGKDAVYSDGASRLLCGSG